MSVVWRIERFDSVVSTQDTVFARARESAREGFVVHADIQEAGRGRHGREWVSKPGNLFLSLLLRPSCELQMVGQLSLLTGLALFEAMAKFCGSESLSLKWPNDVLLGNDKCAGILLETDVTSDGGALDFVVIGVGVNIAHAPMGAKLCDYSDNIDVVSFRNLFLEKFSYLYQQWQNDGFETIRTEWLLHAHPRDIALSVKIGERLEKGFFHDIDAFGNLRLKDETGALKTITAGDVYVTGD